MGCEINLRFRRFSCGTGQITGLNTYYIGLLVPFTTRASLVSGPHQHLNSGELLGPATISACTITMDLDAIICSMIDRLARGPDQDVHVPSVVGPKYPSRGVDVIYL